MRWSVDRLARDRTAARGLALAGLLATFANQANGQVPELSPPNEMPIISKPATPNPTPAPVPPPLPARPTASAPRGRAMLALPGLTTPPSRLNVPVNGPKPALEPAPGEVSLDAPIEMRPLPEAIPIHPAASPGPPPRRPTTPAQPAPTPPKRPRLFGFLPGLSAPKTSTPGRSVAADSLPNDPEAESALKRRIERQAREVVGTRARSVDVKLDGKVAVVVVSGVKFLQKRAVRKQLEGIPALTGLRSTIEVVD